MRKNFKIRSRTIIAGTATLLLIFGLFTPQASALSLSQFPETLANLFKIYNHYKELAEQYWEEIQQIKGIDVRAAVEGAIGALGLPDPFVLSKKISREVNSLPQTIDGINPQVAAERSKSSSLRFVSKAITGKSLDQDALLQIEQQTSSAVGASIDAAQIAFDSNVSQDILRQIAQQQAANAVILQNTQSQLEQATQQAAANNLALLDISQTLDMNEQRRRFEENADVVYAFGQAAFYSELWNTTDTSQQ
jgi:hypothetical protein